MLECQRRILIDVDNLFLDLVNCLFSLRLDFNLAFSSSALADGAVIYAKDSTNFGLLFVTVAVTNLPAIGVGPS
jgi:hypothetical protein